nr:phospholipase-like protein [Tanacetum cinerariifolium]
MYFDHEPQLIDYMLRKHHKVDEYHNDMPLIYYVEGHSLHFKRPEFALITGMRFGTISFCSYTSVDLKFRNRVFPHKVGLVVINLDILGVIEDKVMFGNLCDKDSVRLCLILALEVIFMGRLLTCLVDDSLFGLVENLEAWNDFSWGEHVWTQLYDSIKNVVVKHSDTHYLGLKKDNNYVPTYTLTEFVFAFQERLDQFADSVANLMNDMMNLRRRGDRNDDGVADDDYEEGPVFDGDQYEEESTPVYDTGIQDVIEEEEGFIGKGGSNEEEKDGDKDEETHCRIYFHAQGMPSVLDMDVHYM